MSAVARAAGVSAMTVSNVLNGRTDRVSPATVRNVLEHVERLGYVRNAQAQALSARRSNIIALVYVGSRPGSAAISNPHDGEFIGSVEEQVQRAGRQLMIRSVQDFTDAASLLKSWNIDGAIFLGVLGNYAEELRAAVDRPLVFVDNYASAPSVGRVNIDDFGGGYMSCKYLIDMGHTDIGIVSTEVADRGVVRERYEGALKALHEAGLTLEPHRHWMTEPLFEDGRLLGHEIAEDPPTGIVTTADVLALGVLRGLTEWGVSVPETVSLVGFDDLEAARYSAPQLTTIHQDIVGKGRASVNMLLEMMDGEKAVRDVLPVRLVERESVSAANPLVSPTNG